MSDNVISAINYTFETDLKAILDILPWSMSLPIVETLVQPCSLCILYALQNLRFQNFQNIHLIQFFNERVHSLQIRAHADHFGKEPPDNINKTGYDRN